MKTRFCILTPSQHIKILLLLISFAISTTLISATAIAGSQSGTQSTTHARQVSTKIVKPKIQLAILLDTSSSMSGLIDQTRQQLWQIVNEFSRARQNGVTPVMEVAVYQYGNSGLSSQTGFIQKVSDLTSELDQVSEALFALTTNGGDEYCGYTIRTAVNELQWSQSNNDIKAIFIAGNEPFTQGPVPFKDAIENARQRGITVNTIHAGNYQTGADSGWRDGAMLAGGNYMSIDHNQQVAHIVAPQDKKIAELNAKLNQTYIPYGGKGREKAQRQTAEDAKSEALSPGLLSQRAISKSSAFYRNNSWDLVDALDSGTVKLGELEEEALPTEMKKLDDESQRKYVKEKARERREIQQEIQQLSQARSQYVAAEKRKAAKAGAGANTMNDAIVKAVREQGEKKKFAFE